MMHTHLLPPLPPFAPAPQLEQEQGAAADGQAQLSDACRQLADVAEPPNMKQAFEASLSVALLQSQLGMLENSTGWKMLERDRLGNARAVTLSGWTALLGISSMVVLILWGINYGYKQYRGIEEQPGYTLVVKGKPGGK